MKCYVLLIPGFIHEPTGRSIPPIHTKMQLIQTDPSCLKHWLKPCKHLAMKKALKRRWDLSSSLPVLARVEPWPLSCGWRALAKAWTNSNLPMKVPPPFFWPQLLACFFGRAVAGTLPLCRSQLKLPRNLHKFDSPTHATIPSRCFLQLTCFSFFLLGRPPRAIMPVSKPDQTRVSLLKAGKGRWMWARTFFYSLAKKKKKTMLGRLSTLTSWKQATGREGS